MNRSKIIPRKNKKYFSGNFCCGKYIPEHYSYGIYFPLNA